jgi:transglutaminase-like putative cysteine protease
MWQPKLTCILALFLPIFCLGQKERPVQSDAPTWITTHVVSYESTQLDREAEDGYVDLCYEKQTSLEHNAVFYKKAMRILTDAGVQNCSEVSVEFDPSYQKLSFHSIRILRHGKSIDKLDIKKFRVIEEEKERDRFIYNGSLTALLLLDDVRQGDVLEYSFTLTGFNPIFNNKYSCDYSTRFTVPFYNVYYKLIVPTGRKLMIRNHQTTISPAQTRIGNNIIYEWKQQNLSALHVEDDEAPSWYEGYPYVMVSEYSSWKEVSDWALEVFAPVKTVGPALQKKIEAMNTPNQTDEQKVLSALHFVQDEVRYMGIEMGVNSHKPHAPDAVFAQRFGDCKDKTYLFCTLLQRMNIPAYPVLVNTGYKQRLFEWLPTAHAFDHVTAMVKLNDISYFFDPTISYQRGALGAISYPDYRAGLVVADFTTGLTALTASNQGRADVKEELTIVDMDSPVKMKVTTTVTGGFADDTRYDFHTTSSYEILKNYKKFYASYFDKIEADSLNSTDNPDGSFTTTEFYTIPHFWEYEKGIQKASLQGFIVNSVLKRPKVRGGLPFKLKYPASYHEEVLMNLPGEWNIESFSEHVESSAFRFSSRFLDINKRTALLVFDYESLKDVIAPDELDEYETALDKVDESIGLRLSSDKSAALFSTAPATKMPREKVSMYTYLYTLLLLCIVATWLHRRNKIRGR